MFREACPERSRRAQHDSAICEVRSHDDRTLQRLTFNGARGLQRPAPGPAGFEYDG
jgi:hypothetical protein